MILGVNTSSCHFEINRKNKIIEFNVTQNCCIFNCFITDHMTASHKYGWKFQLHGSKTLPATNRYTRKINSEDQ